MKKRITKIVGSGLLAALLVSGGVPPKVLSLTGFEAAVAEAADLEEVVTLADKVVAFGSYVSIQGGSYRVIGDNRLIFAGNQTPGAAYLKFDEDKTNLFDVDDPNNIGYWLNNELDINYDILENHEWDILDSAGSLIKTVQAKVGLLRTQDQDGLVNGLLAEELSSYPKEFVWLLTPTAGSSENVEVLCTNASGYLCHTSIPTGKTAMLKPVVFVKSDLKIGKGTGTMEDPYFFSVEASEQDVNLRELSVSVGTLSPAFDAEVTDYNVEVPSGSDSVTVTFERVDETAYVKVNGTPTELHSKQIELVDNNTTVVIEVIDGDAKKSYTITFKKAEVEKPSILDKIKNNPDALTIDDLIEAGLTNSVSDHLGEYQSAIKVYMEDKGSDLTTADLQFIIDAVNAVKKAESSSVQEDVDQARSLVKLLSDGHVKEQLGNRLDVVQEKIYTNEANRLVDLAEQSKERTDLENAEKVVAKLPNGDVKESLENRLEELEGFINLHEKLKDLSNRELDSFEEIEDAILELNVLKGELKEVTNDEYHGILLDDFKDAVGHIFQALLSEIKEKHKGKPYRLSEDSLEFIIQYVVEESGVTNTNDQDRIVGAVMAIVQSHATGKDIQNVLRKIQR